MISAYVLVQTEAHTRAAVARRLASIRGIDSVDSTLGQYDVIVHATGQTLDQFAGLVLRRIQETSGVSRTLTCPVVHVA